MEGLVITGRVSARDVDRYCAKALAAIPDPASGFVDLHVHDIEHPDAVAVEAIARMQLTLKRLGRSLRVRGAGPELLDLLDLAGLCDVVPGCDRLGVEPGRKSE